MTNSMTDFNGSQLRLWDIDIRIHGGVDVAFGWGSYDTIVGLMHIAIPVFRGKRVRHRCWKWCDVILVQHLHHLVQVVRRAGVVLFRLNVSHRRLRREHWRATAAYHCLEHGGRDTEPSRQRGRDIFFVRVAAPSPLSLEQYVRNARVPGKGCTPPAQAVRGDIVHGLACRVHEALERDAQSIIRQSLDASILLKGEGGHGGLEGAGVGMSPPGRDRIQGVTWMSLQSDLMRAVKELVSFGAADVKNELMLRHIELNVGTTQAVFGFLGEWL